MPRIPGRRPRRGRPMDVPRPATRACRPTGLRCRGGHAPAVKPTRGRNRGISIEKYLAQARSEEHTSELQSLMRISYAVFCLKKKKKYTRQRKNTISGY